MSIISSLIGHCHDPVVFTHIFGLDRVLRIHGKIKQQVQIAQELSAGQMHLIQDNNRQNALSMV